VPKQKWLELFQASLQAQGSSEAIASGDAIEKELAGCQFSDPRLGRRFRKFAGQLSTRLGQTIPLAERHRFEHSETAQALSARGPLKTFLSIVVF